MKTSRLAAGLLSVVALVAAPGFAQQLLYQERFNDDGATANPPRYAVTGGFLSEPPHDPGSVGPDQLGPVYFARNVETSFVGVPAPTAGRRALLVWDGTLGDGTASADTLMLVANTVKWLAKDVPNATVVFSPNIAAAQGMADHLASLGYAVVDDDGVTSDTAYPANAVVKAPAAPPSRFGQSSLGLLCFSALDHDDVLLSSVGTTAVFEAGAGKIEAPAHPVAAGVPASFTVATGSFNWNLMGDILAGGATTVASMVRLISPPVANLADVDAMAAGTKAAIKSSETNTILDYADASGGEWPQNNPVPGGAAGLWGLVAKGALNVKTAGTYSFALGVDDGARLRIDRNRNGIGPEDNVVNEDLAGAHRAVYGDVDFAAAGLYDFEVVVFNSGGPGDIEMSVSLQAGGGDRSAITSGSWEVLGVTSGEVELSGMLAADSYVPPSQEVPIPMLVVLNGPTDTPPGSVFGGGPFSGFEGTGFFAAAALNKWLPEDITALGGYRSVRLNPVDVTGKPDVKVTVALAASFLDFENTDFLDIIARPNGDAGGEVRLARYSVPTTAAKYFVDIDHGNINRLGLTFLDVTYDVPAGATNLVIEMRAFTSWWNEIAAFDNIRITSGVVTTPPVLGPATTSDGNLNLTWTGGQAPFLVQWSPSLAAGSWIDVQTTQASSAAIPIVGATGFVRVQSGATKTVRLFKSSLSGAKEIPVVDTPATGAGLLALDGTSLTYYVSYAQLTTPAILAHLHGPAPATASAPPLFDLVPVPAFGTNGILSGIRTLTAAEIGHLEGGQTYINVHSAAHGGGEIRGQAVLVP